MAKAHIQVQYNATKGFVGKLSYRLKRPFVITKDVGHNSFDVQLYDEPSSAKIKYKNSELYVLTHALFLSTPLDTID